MSHSTDHALWLNECLLVHLLNKNLLSFIPSTLQCSRDRVTWLIKYSGKVQPSWSLNSTAERLNYIWNLSYHGIKWQNKEHMQISLKSDLDTVLRNIWSKQVVNQKNKQTKKKLKMTETRVWGKKRKKGEEGMTFLFLCLNHENFIYLHSQVSNAIHIFIFQITDFYFFSLRLK